MQLRLRRRSGLGRGVGLRRQQGDRDRRHLNDPYPSFPPFTLWPRYCVSALASINNPASNRKHLRTHSCAFGTIHSRERIRHSAFSIEGLRQRDISRGTKGGGANCLSIWFSVPIRSGRGDSSNPRRSPLARHASRKPRICLLSLTYATVVRPSCRFPDSKL